MEPYSILITEQDYERLSLHIQHSQAKGAQVLEEELAQAKVVPQDQIPKDIVTMNSMIRFLDEQTGKESTITLVYPEDADVGNQRISIFAPVGTALIGLKVGQSIEWPTPNGPRALKVIAILYQPEASGDWHR